MSIPQNKDFKIKGLLCSRLSCLICNDPINEDCVLEQQLSGIQYVSERLDKVINNSVEEAKIINEITLKLEQLTESWIKKLNNFGEGKNEE